MDLGLLVRLAGRSLLTRSRYFRSLKRVNHQRNNLSIIRLFDIGDVSMQIS
jgi:hypothetical protein